VKVRVHELEKKYDICNKEFMKLLKDNGIEVKSHLSGLTDEQVEKIEKLMAIRNGEVESKDDTKKKKKKKRSKAKEQKGKKESKPKTKEKSTKKKGRRSDFVVNKVEDTTDEIIEEDGMKIIKMYDEISLGDLAEKIGVNSSEIIKKLFLQGQMLTINSPIEYEMAEEIAGDYDVIVEKEELVELDFGEKFSLEIEDSEAELEHRAPVITIMGHVDHGKTSLLDALRETNVADGEAGGITQKIGAYQIQKDGQKITFIDTPGHEAFTEMRARGAGVTDIAILVVAADDGVMPQTIEAVSHAKAANVPIIVAVNKIDKEGANPMRVKNELMEHGLVSVEYGGDVEFVEISAKFRKNLDAILETILLTAEILELKGNSKKRAKGVVLESRLDPKVGAVADVLVKEGTLNVGDIIVAGHTDNIPIYNSQFASNWALSAARAVAVGQELLNNSQIKPERMSVTGFADARPLFPNDTAKNRARNRRVEVILVQGDRPEFKKLKDVDLSTKEGHNPAKQIQRDLNYEKGINHKQIQQKVKLPKADSLNLEMEAVSPYDPDAVQNMENIINTWDYLE